MAGKSVTDFLNHRTKDRSGGYLKNWRKRDPPKLNAVLHRAVVPESLWRHQWFNVESREFDGKTETHVRWEHLVCHEDEALLLKRTKRTDEGARLSPPKRCGLCRLGEWVREEIREGRLAPETKIFKFEAEDDEKPTILHAAPFAGLVYDEMDEDAAKHLSKFGISPRSAFKEDGTVKCNYLFAIVDVDNPTAGVQVTIEAAALGAAVQDCLASVIAGEKCDEDPDGAAGDPFAHPYAFQWQYFPNESFSKKYKAIAMRKLKIPPVVFDLVRPVSEGGEVPDLARYVTRFNAKKLRAQMERHWIASGKPPWNEIFPSSVVAEPEREEESTSTSTTKIASGISKTTAASSLPEAKRGPRARGAPKPPEDEDLGPNPDGLPEDSDDVVRCDMPFKGGTCGRLTTEELDVCPRCKHDYRVGSSPKAPPVPAASTASPASAKATKPPAAREEPEEEDEDDIPF